MGEEIEMEINKRVQNILSIIAVICLILPACNFVTGLIAPTPTFTPTPTATDTPIPTNTSTPVPTDTPIPTDTLTPSPSPTVPTRTPTEIPATNTPELAHVVLINQLARNLKVKLRGPEFKTITVNANSTVEFDILPGTYEFSLSATGFIPLEGVKEFFAGDNLWRLIKASP
jgi:hypothetical protein